MYLKRLEIQGFKSFANQTVLDFLPPKNGFNSITAIVGPNGAGKSNVTDAIRWVMGEQSMKNLRGKKSEDVIFNGSESKGALGAAEVTMVLQNDVTETGLDFPELAITRRLYRDGTSEYLVNNNPSRLLDIHLLLAKAKFAEGAYSIVSQGMIDRLLTVGPAERKDFFDEACGIKEHQIKQHQASLKLGRTEENLRQAETLIAEVEPRLKILHKQVKKLEKRHEVETELRDAQEKYYFTIYSKNKIELATLQAQLKNVDDRYRLAFGELENIQTELAELARASTRQDAFDSLQARHQEAVRESNDLERQLAILEGQMHTEYSQVGAQNIGWLEGKIAELKKNQSQLKVALTQAEETVRTSALRLAEQKRLVENSGVDHTQLKLKISRLQNQLIKDQSEQSYREFSGLTAVKAVLEARNRFGGKVYGVVAELGDVAEEYRLALEVAAGAHLSSVVVENEQVARGAIEYLRENRFGVATFLPLNKIQPRGTFGDADSLVHEPGVVGKAIELVRFDSQFHNIFSLALGNTLVVESLKVAERIGIGRARMVTLDGDLVEQKGIMRGGYRNRKNNLGFSSRLSLSQEDRLADLTAEINLEAHNLAELEKAIDASKGKLLEVTVLAESAKSKAAIVEGEYQHLEQEIARLENELSIIKSSPEEYGEHLKKLSKDKETLVRTIESAKSKAHTIEAEIENFNKKEEEKKQRVFALQSEMQKKQDEVNKIVNERNELIIQAVKIETKQEDLAEEVLNDMKVSLTSIVDRVNEGVPTDQLDALADAIQKLKYQLSLIGGIDEEVVAEYNQTKERYDFLTTQLADLSKATEDLYAMIEELDELMKKKRSSAFKKIRKEFGRYFQILFNGGNADLEEVYGEVEEEAGVAVNPDGTPVAEESVEADEENKKPKKKEKVLTGIEVIANPPGKKVKYLNMLSGGERTLTSIALICAILYHNPSPFVVLDEVEAALDEANTLRFVKIMSELSTHSQFIIVTHNRVTMHAANALYGVVMQGDGVSKLLSVKLEDVPEYEDVQKQS